MTKAGSLGGRCRIVPCRIVPWRLVVVAITIAAVLVRLLVIAHSRGGEDLRMYTYFSRLPLHGVDPFAPPASALYPAIDSNNPPVEVATFTGLLAIHDSPTTLRLLFVLADAAVLLLLGFAMARSRRWRVGMLLFYGFNPFVLFSFTAFAEDKTLLFLGILCWMLALERGREWGAWASATALAVFKFLGAFAMPVLALHAWRRRRADALVPVAACLAVVAASNLLWFPSSLDAFPRRDLRLDLAVPLHASPLLLLSRIGLYAPIEAKLLSVAGFAAVLALFGRRRIDVREAVVLAIAAGYVFLPDDAANRLLLITLALLLLLDLSVRRWLVVWAISCVATLGVVVATKGVPHELAGVAPLLRTIFARESTVRHVLWMNLLPAVVLRWYLRDRRDRRAPVLPAPHLCEP
jgi:hypothetical protein